MTALQPGQIPCPDCAQPLALPIEAVLAGRPIICAGCGLELQVNAKQSASALAALGRWWQETASARTAAEGGAAAASQPGNTGRRLRRSRS